MPDGRVARFEVPEGTTPDQAQSMMEDYFKNQEAAAQPAQPQGRGFLGDLAHTAGYQARAVYEGVADLVDTPVHIANLGIMGVNKLADKNISTMTPPAGTAMRKYLDFIRVPKPEGAGERVFSKTISGAAGAGPFGAIPAASGAMGGAMAQSSAERGEGPFAQLVYGILGSMAPTNATNAIANLGKAGYKSWKDISNPANRANIGRILRESADDPDAVMARLGKVDEIVPGSRPTAGEISGDNRFIAEQSSFERRNPGTAIDTARQINKAARNRYLDDIAGTPEDVAAAVARRERETSPMRNAAFDKFKNDPRLPDTEYKAFAEGIRSQAKALSGLDLTQKANARKLTDWLTDAGFEVSSQASKSGKSSVYTAVRTDPVTGEAKTVKFRVGSNAMPASVPRDYIDLSKKDGMQVLATQIAQATPLKPGVNPNFAKGIIKRRLESPEGNLSDVSEGMRHALKRIVNAINMGDPEYAYGLRKSLANDIADHLAAKKGGVPIDDPKKYQRLAAGMTGDILESLDNQIERAAPGYREYMKKFSEMSRPIQQMEELQSIQQRIRATGQDAAGQSDMLLGRLNSILSPEGQQALNRVLTPEQMQRLYNLQADKSRQSIMNSVRPAGSNTAADIAASKRLDAVIGQLIAENALGRIPLAGRLVRPLMRNAMEGEGRKEIVQALGEAYADPAEARAAMEAALRALQGEKVPVQMKRVALQSLLGSSIGSLPVAAGQEIMGQ